MTVTKYRNPGAAVAGATRVPNPYPGGGSPFFDYARSPIYTPIPANAPLTTGRGVSGGGGYVAPSAQLVQTFINECNREFSQTTVAPTFLHTTRATMIVAPDDTPRRTDISIENTSFADDLRAEFAKGIPLPDWAFSSQGGDNAMALWSPQMDCYWEFFQMNQGLAPISFAYGSTSSGGTLPAGTHTYTVTGFNTNGETRTGKYLGITVNGSQRAHFSWEPYEVVSPVRHLGYRVYRANSFIADVGPSTNVFIDDGSLPLDTTRHPPPAPGNASTPGYWACTWGGVAYNVSESPGYFRTKTHAVGHPDVPGPVTEKFHWGESATQIFTQAQMIQKGDLVRGVIDHQIGMALHNVPGIVHNSVWAFPAQGTDGHSTLVNRIPYGILFRFPYSDAQGTLDFDAWSFFPNNPRLDRFTRMVAKAIQRYGLMPREGSVNNIVYPENVKNYFNPNHRQGTPEAPIDNFIYDDGAGTNFMSTYGPATFTEARQCFMALPLSRLVVVNAAFCNNTSAPCPRGGKII